ncbi:aminotransferase class V-fold PLP-dependent enzyme [Ulvibacterium marinum]|uniref:aminotransferase class V-fold PLP-dependent enzyme n=1 Tax=Ulvibacterium marinum TaxID=2419782 RepID=UPI0024947F9C|nr:aminotransferase class V-fold PLP-dependent enzyme [Ulvibacterium marinum]
MENIRREFPLLDTCVYLNTASSGLLSKSLVDWRHKHDQAFFEKGSGMKVKAIMDLIPETRNTVAQFFNCRMTNVALTPNFSLGMNLLLDGLNKKHKVLLLENDYPSVNWLFEQREFAVDYVKIDEHLEEEIYKKVKSGKVSILALSVVQWLNGIQIDLDFLKDLKKEFPNLYIIADGTQFLGTKDFDFDTSAIDVLGTSTYKWLLSGYGNGFFLFKDRAKELFSVKSVGFNSVNGDMSKKEKIEFVKHLEPGHLDTFNFGSLKFSLNSLTSIGIKKIEEQNRRLRKKAMQELNDLGLLKAFILQRKSHGNILNIPGGEKCFQELANNNIICSQRGGGIRLSLHFYNNENDIDAVINVLKTRG